MFEDRIRERLLQTAGLTTDQIKDALEAEHESGQTLDQILVGRKFLPEHR